jgi:hypothetical protein
MSLLEHARRELELIGEEPETIEGYLKVIQAFADMGHSGGSAMCAIPVINQLLQYKSLSELTEDPNEWMYIGTEVWGDAEGQGIWQSKRNPEAFSNDGGKNYYLLSERAEEHFIAKLFQLPPKLHRSKRTDLFIAQ